MVVSCGLHHDTGFTIQVPQPSGQLTQLSIGVPHLKRRDHHLSQGPHDGNHALAFGNINAYTVHVHSPNTKICNRNPSFSRCRFNLLGDANSRLNLLKPNAATRGWLAVLISDFTAQGGTGQPVAPLIVALARDGRNPRLAAKGSNQIIL